MSVPQNNEEGHQNQACALDSCYKSDYSILVLDNGSYSIKAGYAGHRAPTLCFQNCAVQPFGKRQAGGNHSCLNTPGAGIGSPITYSGHHSASGQSLGKQSGLVFGDDIYGVSEYFCIRPFKYGLLLDEELEVSVWEKLFSKPYLNISDFSSCGVLVTEHYNTPASCRFTLTQIVFEEFGFDRMVISPGQQLVPFSFGVGLPAQDVGVFDFRGFPDCVSGKKTRRPHDFSSIKTWCIREFENAVPVAPVDRSFPLTQLVVDVGHQTTWIVPFYGEMPLEAATMRIDLGGAHISALLKNLIGYRQVDLERNELLIHHIKEESCFTSLNFIQDLRLARSRLSYPSACGLDAITHLSHRYYLPNLSVKENQKNTLKRFFKTARRSHLPQYEIEKRDSGWSSWVDLQPKVVQISPLSDLMSFDTLPCNDAECGLEKPSTDDEHNAQSKDSDSLDHSATGRSAWNDKSQPSREAQAGIVHMNIERISPPELLFYPSDYDFSDKKIVASSTAGTNTSTPTIAPLFYRDHASRQGATTTFEAFQPPKPGKQCGIAEGIERAIFACPPLLQSHMANRILLCGGTSNLPNFARRLYLELRARLPENWPICIFQQESPDLTPWIGGSVWAGSQDSSCYYTFALTRAQYAETG